MGTKAQIFLGNLKLHHQGRLGHSAKHGVKGFPGLKVNGAVFDLYQYIFHELAIVGNKFGIRLFGPVRFIFFGIHKSTPDYHPSVRLHGLRQHIGTIHMCPTIILGSRLTL